VIFRTCPDRLWGPPSLLYNGYRVFPEGKERPGRDVDPSPLLVPWSRKSRAIPLLPLWAVRPVQSLSACTRVHFTLHLPLPSILKYFLSGVPRTPQRKTEETSCHMPQPTFQIHNQIPTLFEVLRNKRLKKSLNYIKVP